jgi:hypothetical protein
MRASRSIMPSSSRIRSKNLSGGRDQHELGLNVMSANVVQSSGFVEMLARALVAVEERTET